MENEDGEQGWQVHADHVQLHGDHSGLRVLGERALQDYGCAAHHEHHDE